MEEIVQFFGGWIPFLVLILWSFVWKGLALWRAAKRDEKTWFILLLVLNTVGILDIFYMFIYPKIATGSRRSEVKDNIQ